MKNLAIILISLSAVSELLTVLVSSKKFKGIFCIAVSCVALLTLLKGIQGFSLSDFKISDSEKSEYYESAEETEMKIDDYVVEAGEKALSTALIESMNEKEIFPEKTEVIMDRNEDKSIYIKEIIITLSENQKYLKSAVKTIAENYLENKITVTVM